MYVDCEFRLKDDGGGIPAPILTSLFDVLHLLRKLDGDYYISYQGGGSFHFGNKGSCFPLEKDLSALIEMDMLASWHLRAFFWLKRNTVYTGGFKNDDADSIVRPYDFFVYVEEVIRRF